MKRFFRAAFLFTAVLALYSPASAHFGMLIPSDSMINQSDSRDLKVDASFSHPFEGVGMPLEKPAVFDLYLNGSRQSLLDRLTPVKIMDQAAWQLDYRVKQPGMYIFYMKPVPYWEPAEDCFIIHHTKTCVAAFGDDEGWDKELGLKTEIIPLSKPFGLYAGNIFQGIVKLDGKPVPYAEVEVEYYNEDSGAKAPSELMVTQTIKADRNGVFSYAAPKSGWWGFAALNEADFKLKLKSGEEKGVELGAVIWVKFHDWNSK